jgi:hypothetical protein
VTDPTALAQARQDKAFQRFLALLCGTYLEGAAGSIVIVWRDTIYVLLPPPT